MGGERQHVNVHGVGNLNVAEVISKKTCNTNLDQIVQLFQESFRATLSSSLHTEVNCVNSILGLLAQPHSQTSNCSVLDHLQSAVRYSVSHQKQQATLGSVWHNRAFPNSTIVVSAGVSK